MDEAQAQQLPDKPKIWGPIPGIFLGLLAYFVAQIVIAVVLFVIASFNGQSITDYYDQNLIIASFLGSVALASVSIGMVYLYTKGYGAWRSLQLARPTLGQLKWVLPAILGYLIFTAILFAIADQFFPSIDLEQDQELGFENAQGIQVALGFIALVILAPVSEEILFRGYTFQGVRRSFNWIIAAVISAGLFGLAHFQMNVAIDTFALGVTACWLLKKTGSLWTAILLHGIKNFVAFYFLFLA